MLLLVGMVQPLLLYPTLWPLLDTALLQLLVTVLLLLLLDTLVLLLLLIAVALRPPKDFRTEKNIAAGGAPYGRQAIHLEVILSLLPPLLFLLPLLPLLAPSVTLGAV